MDKKQKLQLEIEELVLQDINLRNSLAGAGNREFDRLSHLQSIIQEKLEVKRKELEELS